MEKLALTKSVYYYNFFDLKFLPFSTASHLAALADTKPLGLNKHKGLRSDGFPGSAPLPESI